MGKLGQLGLLIMGLGASVAFGKNVYLLDFDDTIVETRKEYGGTFQTYYRLYRNHLRSNVLQEVPRGPQFVDVTPIDYHRIHKYLGTENGKPGRPVRVTLESGETIIAGEYMVRIPETYMYFGELHDDDRNYLLEDQKAAEERDPKGSWKGPMWSVMTYLLSSKRTADDFGIITARGHTTEHWEAYFRHLKNRKEDGKKAGFISYMPNMKYIRNTGHPYYDRFSTDKDKVHQKIGVLERTIRDLARVPVTEADRKLHPNGKEEGLFHTLIFSDDRQDTLEAAIDLFQGFAWTRTVPIKFIVVNTGYKKDIRESQRPQYAVLNPDGTFRAATSREILGEPENLTESEAERFLEGKLSCQQLISKQEAK